MVPVAAPCGTTARISLSERTVKELEGTPLKSTFVAPLKNSPLTVTEVPTGPLAGVNEVMTGSLKNEKLLALVAVPAGVVTVILPLVVTGTTPLSSVSEIKVKLADTPLKAT